MEGSSRIIGKMSPKYILVEKFVTIAICDNGQEIKYDISSIKICNYSSRCGFHE